VERELLRTLCTGRIAARVRQKIANDLAHYAWRDGENRIVFEALTRLRGHELENIRGALPAVATRMGFPDVNWDAYFLGDRDAPTDPAALARALLAAAQSK
jgi:glycosyltransferase involved in cell wall biosynthesis